MNKSRTVRLAPGFSLIELMISMLLGLLVLGAAIAVFSSNRTTYQANQGLGRVQENARIAFEMMARDLRSAGGTACSNLSKPEPTTLPGWWATFPQNAIAPHAETGRVAGSDGLAVTSSGDAPIGIEAHTGTTLTLRTANHGFVNNSVLVVCDSNKVFLVQATNVAGKVITHAGLPDGYDFFYNDLSSEASVAVASFTANQWYVKPNGRGSNSLYRKPISGFEEEVAPGVNDMQLTYLERGGAAYGATPANWGNVIAVRMVLTLVGQDSGGTPITRTLDNVVSLRTRTI